MNSMFEKIPTRRNFDCVRVTELCQILIGGPRAKMLGREILEQFSTGYLTGRTYQRLSKWADPDRAEWDVQPFAEAICYELFGMRISRVGPIDGDE